MGELLQAYGGTSCALAPDDGEHDIDAAVLADMALCSGARATLAILRKRAATEFPPAIPALDAMLLDVSKAQRHSGSLPVLPEQYKDREPAYVVRMAFCIAAKATVKKLYSRAAAEFPALLPALDALLYEVEEVRHYRGSLWELSGEAKPYPN